MTNNDVDGLIQNWAAAERSGDAIAISQLTTDDFTAVGPKGFVLDKQAWLWRYESNGLRNTAFAVTDTATRHYGDVAVVLGIQDQTGEYDGHDVSGRFRVTLIARHSDGEWRLAGLHLSPVAKGF